MYYQSNHRNPNIECSSTSTIYIFRDQIDIDGNTNQLMKLSFQYMYDYPRRILVIVAST
jgi:hypothetical protein